VSLPITARSGIPGDLPDVLSLTTHGRLCLVDLIFLGAFAKLLKATISFVVSVRPSVCLSLSVRPSVSVATAMIFIKTDTEYFLEICRYNSSFNQI